MHKKIGRTTIGGLAVVVAMLFGAQVSAAATAPVGFLPEPPEVLLHGDEGSAFELGLDVTTLTCEAPEFSEGIDAPSASLTSGGIGESPCNPFFSFNPVVKMNDCQFTFAPGEETGEGAFDGAIDIGPEACSGVTVKVGDCDVEIGPQEGLDASYENTGSGDEAGVTIEMDATGLEYTQDGSLWCEGGSYSNGTWSGTWELSGEDGLNEPAGIEVGEMHVGFFIEGEESQQPQFAGEFYPAAVLGFQDEANGVSLGVNDGTVECETLQLGHGLLGAHDAMSLSVQSSGCVSFGWLNVPWRMNGCYLRAALLNEGPPYVGELGIECTPGEQIEFRSPGCWVTIGGQEGLEGLSFANVGSGRERAVSVDLDIDGIAYTETEKGLFPSCSGDGGSYENGTLSGSLTLEGQTGELIG